MAIVCTVLEIDLTPGENAVTLGFPDAGNQVVIDVDDGELQGLKPGGQFSVALVPFVDADNPSAIPAGDDAATVPADHPVVMDPDDAADAAPADAAAIAATMPAADSGAAPASAAGQ